MKLFLIIVLLVGGFIYGLLPLLKNLKDNE